LNSAVAILRRRAEHACREVVARVPPGAIRAAFAGGSVARDEVWFATVGPSRELEIYSDVDLFVVVADDAQADLVRSCARDVVAALPSQADGARFLRGVDAGVYYLSDLLTQPVRPGTADLADRHVWLYGDRSLTEPMRRAFGGSMAPAEALYLLENRAWDVLDPALGASDPQSRLKCVQALKAILDVGTAHLIVEGRFSPRLDERMRALQSNRPARLSSRVAATIGDALAARARLDEYLATGCPGGEAAAALVAEAWCELAPGVLGVAGSPDRLLAARCRRGHVLANHREFVRMRSARQSRVSAAVVGGRYARMAPRAALRTYALSCVLARRGVLTAHSAGEHAGYVEGLAAALGATRGTTTERARWALGERP
jgi:hypothetical protein